MYSKLKQRRLNNQLENQTYKKQKNVAYVS